MFKILRSMLGAVILISFLYAEILACPAVSGFQVNPNPVAVGQIVTFSAVITPKEGQTLVDWNLTVDGQVVMSGTGGGVQSDGVAFETHGKKSATLTGTWKDKDGKTHTGFIGDPDTEFYVFQIEITFVPLYMCTVETKQILTAINPSDINRTLNWNILQDTTGGATVDSNGNVKSGQNEGFITVKVYDSKFTIHMKTSFIRVVFPGQTSNPTQDDICKTHPIACVVAWAFGTSARTWAESVFPNDIEAQRSIRHSAWSCTMASDPNIGPEVSKLIGDAHENVPGNSCYDKTKAMTNNEIGRNLNADGSFQGCTTASLEAYNQGKLVK